VPERHLGLHLPSEVGADHAERLATLIEENVDLDALVAAAAVERRPASVPVASASGHRVRIGVARDEAFCFYYEDNLDLLADAGAELVEFSPISDPLPDGLDGLYLGGGYPELHAAELAANAGTRRAIAALAAAGAPVYGECGGLMYLGHRLTVDGERFEMCGVLPLSTKMPARLSLTYVEVRTTGGLFGPDHIARGHMFHHSELDGARPEDCCYEVQTSRGAGFREGYGTGNMLASYAHLHFASDPSLAVSFVEHCEKFANR
jgi:cobyrinic acid a,c-diamide synthase